MLLEAGPNRDIIEGEDGVTPATLAVDQGRTECLKILLEAGADIDKADRLGRTPLNVAASKGQIQCVKLLLEAGADIGKDGLGPEGSDDSDWTAAHCAAMMGHTECLRALLEAGADKDQNTTRGCAPAHIAACCGHPDCLRLLLEAGANIDSTDNVLGSTPLILAAFGGKTECVRVLIDAGADIAIVGTDGETALSCAERYGHDEVATLLRAAADVRRTVAELEALRIDDSGPQRSSMRVRPGDVNNAASRRDARKLRRLLQAGADKDDAVASPDGDNFTALLGAASMGNADCVHLLLEAGADPDKGFWGPDGVELGSPAHMAAHYGHVDCIRMLLEAGGNRDIIDGKDEATPALAAARQGRTECLRLLLEAGAEIDKADRLGRTPLHVAARKGHIQCLKVLLEAGADIGKGGLGPEGSDDSEWTAAHYAASCRGTDCLLVLLEAGADKDKTTTKGYAPTHVVACCGHPDCLRLLLEAGANIDRTDHVLGSTPLMLAAFGGKTECVRVLFDAGADIAIVGTEGQSALSCGESLGYDEAAGLLRAAADERRTVAELEALRVGDSGPQRSGRSRSSRRRCAHCGKTSAQVKAEGGKMQKCAACTNAADTDIVPPRYCSRACQVAAWPEHKKVCAGRAGSARARDD